MLNQRGGPHTFSEHLLILRPRSPGSKNCVCDSVTLDSPQKNWCVCIHIYIYIHNIYRGYIYIIIYVYIRKYIIIYIRIWCKYVYASCWHVIISYIQIFTVSPDESSSTIVHLLWWEEHGLIMEKPEFPMPPGKQLRLYEGILTVMARVIPLISTELAPFIECIIPLITKYIATKRP